MAEHIDFEGLSGEEITAKAPGSYSHDHWYYLLRDNIPHDTFFYPDSERNLAVYDFYGTYLGYIDIFNAKYVEDGKQEQPG